MRKLLPLYAALSVLTGCSSSQLQTGNSAHDWIEPVKPKIYESQDAIARPLFETYEPGEIQVFPHSRLGQTEAQRASPSEVQRSGRATPVATAKPASESDESRDEIVALENRIVELEAQLSAMSATLVQLEQTNSALKASQPVSQTTVQGKNLSGTSRHVSLKASESDTEQSDPVIADPSDIVVFFESRQAASMAINELRRAGHNDSFLSFSHTRQTYVLYLGRYNRVQDSLSLIGSLKQLLPLEYQILAGDRVLTPSAFSA